MSSPVGACASAGDPRASPSPVARLGLQRGRRCELPRTVDRVVSHPARLPDRGVRLPSTATLPRRIEQQLPDLPPTGTASASWTRLAFGLPPPSLLTMMALRHLSSDPGGRALSGTRVTLDRPFAQVKTYFRSSQGYPPRCGVSHRISFLVHCVSTGCAQVRR